MDNNKIVNQLIQYLKEELIKNGLNSNSIALFGSALNGIMNEDSDIDLIIISDQFEGLDIFQRAKITMNAELLTLKKFLIPMDIINLTQEEFKSSNFNQFNLSKIVA